jgi:glycosyltransferase involved in cell wall biosynthesis
MRILLLIRSLNTGGAERQLIVTAKGLKARGHDVTVALFYDEGSSIADLRASHIEVVALGKMGRWDVIRPTTRLLNIIQRRKIESVYSFMPAANLVATLAKSLRRPFRLVWGVRSAKLNLKNYPFDKFLFYVSGSFAKIADAIVVNSVLGLDELETSGWPRDRLFFVPNGIDTELFRPAAEARTRMRAAWNIRPEHYLVGVVARIDPLKDHVSFLNAARTALRQNPNLRFVCIGGGDDGLAADLCQLSRALKLEQYVKWCDNMTNVNEAYAALDGFVSSSLAEGFSNSLAEAMATDLPVVVTDVGDSRRIVGDTGWVVPPGNPELLAQGILEMANSESHLRPSPRKRIETLFSIQHMLDEIEEILEQNPRVPA